jgi:hypothetical protein
LAKAFDDFPLIQVSGPLREALEGTEDAVSLPLLAARYVGVVGGGGLARRQQALDAREEHALILLPLPSVLALLAATPKVRSGGLFGWRVAVGRRVRVHGGGTVGVRR